MFRAKLLAIAVGMLATLAVSVSPAFAEFKSTNGKTSGAGKSGPVVLEGGGATLECTSAEGKGTVENAKGEAALSGPTLELNTEKWNGCKAKTKAGITSTPTVGPCVLLLKQKAGEAEALGSVKSACKIVSKVLFITCEITVVPESEGNINLKKNSLANSGGNLTITAADEGITTKVSSGCKTGGVVASKENKQKATVTGEGVNFS